MANREEPLHQVADDLFKKMDLFPNEYRNAYIMGFLDGALHQMKNHHQVNVKVTIEPQEKNAN